MSFGKPGRPSEDRLVRQREIYLAVVPLLEQAGVRRLSMRAAADAACMSVGGLYHYFPTKRDLVLHGISGDGLSRFCMDDFDELARNAGGDIAGRLSAYLAHTIRVIFFARPAFYAAVELGVPTLQATMDATLSRMATSTYEQLGAVTGLSGAALDGLSRAFNRTVLGAVLDRNATEQQMSQQLRALVEGYFAAERIDVDLAAIELSCLTA